MTIDRLHDLAAPFSVHSSDVDEHQAAIDLLVLTAFCDHRITQDELDALEQFDVDHTTWDEGGFSVQQYLPSAMAKVRSALDKPDGADRLLKESAAAIKTATLKEETVSACAALAASGGVDEAETDFVGRVRASLGAPPAL
jgi:hypothetical protein